MSTTPEWWGVVNVTPDSFSDGGKFLDPAAAVSHAKQLVEAGATVIDVGAESTRPGAARIDCEEEIRRLRPVVQSLVRAGITVSVDTMRAETAREMLELGASIINDVSGGLADPQMHSVLADSAADYVVMHWRGHSDTMDTLAEYHDVVAEVALHLRERVDAAVTAGIAAERIWLDPGLGFAKNPEHNFALCAGIGEIVDLGHRVLVGASRKRFLGTLLPEGNTPEQRDGVSAALATLLAGAGVSAFRVHNVSAHRDALEVWSALESASNRAE
jgi:dihydropteroate synthase